jgi:hypothetical protein
MDIQLTMFFATIHQFPFVTWYMVRVTIRGIVIGIMGNIKNRFVVDPQVIFTHLFRNVMSAHGLMNADE